jgi:hypothetical protein
LFSNTRLLCPVLDSQAGDCLQVGVVTDDCAISECQRNRGHLLVDLLNDTPDSFQLGEDLAINIGGRLFVRPANKLGEARAGDFPRTVSAAAGFQTADNLTKYQDANADLAAPLPQLSNAASTTFRLKR